MLNRQGNSDASTPKNAQEGHILTVLGDQYTDLFVADILQLCKKWIRSGIRLYKI
ncbi:hypothetical protein [Paenibacillus sp. RC67]|uniref:hypothetical protein n=1 Tax=Paenibacillus sp. RC67 TaxID=3039392 RepID=UPI0024AD67D3|nr:hypothetical protein [Paenibacillus sp. RC67]